MKLYKKFFLLVSFTRLFFALLLISSCAQSTDKSGLSSSEAASSQTNTDTPSVRIPDFSPSSMEVKTYEVKDSTGKSHGWGYDIYVRNKKIIHQPIIPAIPGNTSFKTETDARKTGLFAMDKMIKGGTLPTLLIKELDSLGITK